VLLFGLFCYFSVFFFVSFQKDLLGTHLFVKVPRPGDSEVTTFSVFESRRRWARSFSWWP